MLTGATLLKNNVMFLILLECLSMVTVYEAGMAWGCLSQDPAE